MKRPLLAALAFGLACAGDAPARAAQVFHESFDTTTHRDGGQTTAFWDTGSGRLSLFPAPPTNLGTFNTPGTALAVTLRGNVAYVADGTDGLRIVDVTNTAAPSAIGSFDTPGTAKGVAASRDIVLVADGAAGLQILKAASLTSPSLLGTFDTDGDARAVAMSGTRAFVADGAAGLQVISFANTAAPTRLATYVTPGPATGVVLLRNLALVTCGGGGLLLLDVSNPASPLPLGALDTPGVAQGVAVSGDLALVADDTAGLQLVDIADPANPTLLGTYDTPGAASAVALAGDLAVVADAAAGLVVVDLTNPAAPTLAGALDTPGDARGVALAAGVAFVADGSPGLADIRVSRLIATPRELGSHGSAAQYLEVVTQGDLAAVAALGGGIELLDISTPGAPQLLGAYNTPDFTWGVALAGHRLYAADDLSGLLVFDITNPAAPLLLGTYNSPGSAQGVAVYGDRYVLLADGPTGLLVIDVLDPAHPALAGVLDTPGYAYTVFVEGTLAYVADGLGGLRIISLANPAAPVLAGALDTPGTAWDVAVAGNRACVADGMSGVPIIDCTNPAAPVLLSTYTNPSDNFYGVDMEGSLLVTTSASIGVRALDITNGAAPALVASLNLPEQVNRPTLVGERLLLANGSTVGVRVLQLMQHDADPLQGVARSLVNVVSPGLMRRVRLLTTQTPGVTWECSLDGSATWQPITPGAAWSVPTTPGSSFTWRSTLNWVAPGGNPSVTDLRFEWLTAEASIDAVRDIPNDQGRQVRVSWTRSSHDFAGDATPITQYAVYRRIDAGLLAAGRRAPVAPASAGYAALDPVARQNALEMQALGWDFVTTVPALTEDTYAVVAPTLRDSTIADGPWRTTFRVTALTATPGVFFHSAPDSGSSVDNLAPFVPTNLFVAYHTGPGNYLSWDEAPVADFQYFRIYRSPDPAAPPSGATFVHATTSQNWLDTAYNGGAVYYRVTAVDFAGNESAPAAPAGVSGVGEDEARPAAATLGPGTPNPFHAATRLSFALPVAGPVTLEIFDVAGRRVRTLLEAVRPAGAQAAEWDGRDDDGRRVPAGVYLSRLRAGGVTRVGRVTLAR